MAATAEIMQVDALAPMPADIFSPISTETADNSSQQASAHNLGTEQGSKTERRLSRSGTFTRRMSTDSGFASPKAKAYDAQMSANHSGANKSVTRKFLGALAKQPPTSTRKARILDAGCGSGLLGQHIRQWASQLIDGEQLHLTGVDINDELLELAESKGCFEDLLIADLKQPLPFEGETFDYVLASGVFVPGVCGPEALPTMLAPLVAGGYGIFTVCEAFFKQEGDAFRDAIKSVGCNLLEADLMPYYGSRMANVLIVQKTL